MNFCADDLTDAYICALKHWNPKAEDAPNNDQGEPLAFLNFRTGIDLSIKNLVQQVADAVGYTGTIHWDTRKPDGTPKKQLDVRRLAAMGRKAKIDSGMDFRRQLLIISTDGAKANCAVDREGWTFPSLSGTLLAWLKG